MQWFHRLISKSQYHLLINKDGPHSLLDDLQGLFTGIVLMIIGVMLFKAAGLLTGGIMGVGLLLHYLFGSSLALTLIVINIPFYIMGYFRFGLRFALKSLLVIVLLSVGLVVTPKWLAIQSVNPYFASVAGGLLVGVGLIMLFRHRSSTGGFNVLVLYLQDRFAWNAGLCQLLLDIVVLSSSFFISPPSLVPASFLGAVVVNLTISINHRPGRYISF